MDTRQEPPKNTPWKDSLFSLDFEELEKITEENLGFAAITDGLGFHQKHKKIGELRPANILEEKDPTIEEVLLEHTRPITPPTREFSENDIAQPEAPLDHKISIHYASLAERLLATGLDITFVCVPLLLSFFYNFVDQPRLLLENWFSAFCLMAIVFFSYRFFLDALGGQTLGKMILGLSVVEDDKYRKPISFRTAYRRLGFMLLGFLPFGLGFWSAIWDSKARTWHDKLAASIVERK